MKFKVTLLLMSIMLFTNVFSQNQTLLRKVASTYSKDVSSILMNEDKYSSSKEVTVEIILQHTLKIHHHLQVNM